MHRYKSSAAETELPCSQICWWVGAFVISPDVLVRIPGCKTPSVPREITASKQVSKLISAADLVRGRDRGAEWLNTLWKVWCSSNFLWFIPLKWEHFYYFCYIFITYIFWKSWPLLLPLSRSGQILIYTFCSSQPLLHVILCMWRSIFIWVTSFKYTGLLEKTRGTRVTQNSQHHLWSLWGRIHPCSLLSCALFE